MHINTQYRSRETEIMDDFSFQGEELEQALSGIARINQLLGGNSITLNAVDELMNEWNKKEMINILDLGCGNGDMLRTLAERLHKKGYKCCMTGMDANAFTIQNAEKLSAPYKDISYQCTDFMQADIEPGQYDIILLTLTLHHFNDAEILSLLRKCRPAARLGIVVNDLQRSRLAYFLFGIVSRVFGLNHININDGRLSILRGFKRKELIALAHKLNLKKYTIRWKWAFRYQWIISDL